MHKTSQRTPQKLQSPGCLPMTPEKSRYADLIAKLEGATGKLPDETLAEFIAAIHEQTLTNHWIEMGDGGEDFFRVETKEDAYAYGASRHLCPDLSLDAALALVERKLPGQGWAISREGVECFHATVGMNCDGVSRSWTAPLALCSALLKALEASQ